MNRRTLAAVLALATAAAITIAWKAGVFRGSATDEAIGPPETPNGTRIERAGTPIGSATASPAEAPSGVSASGKVVADGRPFEGARITAVYFDRNRGTIAAASSEETHSAKDGTFTLGNLPAPPFRLRAEAPGWRPGWAEVGSFGEKKTLEGFELELLAAGTIAGRVTAGGIPVANARVFAGDEQSNDLGGSLEAQTSSHDNGAFLLDPVRPGRMTVVAHSPANGYAVAVVEVRAGEEARAELALMPLGTAKGRVVDEGGAPMAGVAVVAIDAGDHDLLPKTDGASKRLLTVASRLQTTLTDADGRFTFASLTSRNVSFAANVPGYKPAYGHMPSANETDALVELTLTPDHGR